MTPSIPQPNQATYPFSPALNLFTTDTTIGPFIDDPTSPRQAWHDPTAAALAPTQLISYFYWNQNTGAKVSFTRTAAQASKPNLAGTYAPYVIAPSLVTVTYVVNGATIGPLTLDPKVLIDPVDAAALAAELSAAIGVPFSVVNLTLPNGTVNQNGDTRAWLGVKSPVMLQATNAQALRILEYARGVGAPGQWNVDAGGNPVWHAALPPGIALDPIPTPQRDLLPNEQIVQASAGPGIYYFQVQRTDLAQATGSGSTSANASALDQDTNTVVHKIAQALAIQL